jgi:hypothetical protein
MTDQFSNLAKIALIAILITLVWALSVAFTYWDTHHQRFETKKVYTWLGLVTFLPFIGFIAYIIFRISSQVKTIKSNSGEPKTRRETALKPPARRRPMSTIDASDLDLQRIRDAETAVQSGVARRTVNPRYFFAVSSGADQGKEFVIENLPARIGRGPEASIRLDGDLGVSRKHADLYDKAGILRIRDLDSAHGTYVNNHRIQDKNLEPGDQVKMGSTVLVLRMIKE